MPNQVHIGGFQTAARLEMGQPRDKCLKSARTVSELPTSISLALADPLHRDSIGEGIAQSEEFVTFPEMTGELQKVLPLVMSDALRDAEGFSGCMVFVSEQEARLVTVTTLWRGRDADKHCDRSTKRLKRLLEPYVDRWLRARRFAAVLTIPQPLAGDQRLEGQSGQKIQPSAAEACVVE